jgi:hypothetical protein
MQFHLVRVQRNVDQLLCSLNTLDTIVAHADSLDDPFAVELLEHRKDGVDFFSLTGAVVVEEIDSFGSELFSALLDTISDVFGGFFWLLEVAYFRSDKHLFAVDRRSVKRVTNFRLVAIQAAVSTCR